MEKVLVFREAFKIVQKIMGGAFFSMQYEAGQHSPKDKIYCKCLIYSSKKRPYFTKPCKNWHEAIADLREHLNGDESPVIDPLKSAPF